VIFVTVDTSLFVVTVAATMKATNAPSPALQYQKAGNGIPCASGRCRLEAAANAGNPIALLEA
jgi:hypothetical protein